MKEGKKYSKLVTGINETETKTFENLKSTVLLQMGLPESNKKLSQHTMVRGSTNKIRKTDEEATFHACECKEQKLTEAKFVGTNANSWEEMSVKGDTNTILREHNRKLSQASLILIPVPVDNQDKR